MKYIRSNLLWCGVILLVKCVYYILRIIRIQLPNHTWLWPPRVWDKGTRRRSEQYNTNHEKKAIYKKIYDANVLNHPLPKTIDSVIHPTLLAYAKEKQYEQFVAKIPDAKIAWTYTTITPDNRILRDSVWYPWENIYSNPYSYKLSLGAFEKRSGNIAVLTWNDSFKNYNHWMTFWLPKYHLMQKSWFDIDFYITDHGTKYHKESLEAVWLSVDKMIIPDQKTRIQADNLFIASTTTVSWNIPQRTVEFLRDTFLKDINPTPTDKKKRIFLSRVTTRKLQNEIEIMDILAPLWFEIAILDDMSIKQQAQLFASAEIVMWPHGAWFTNVVFCSPWTKVIELFHPKTVWWHYYCMSATCDLDYWYIMGQEVERPWMIRMDNDMIISPEKMHATLEMMKIE